uniref:ATP synthase subunit a n=1 Tax=Pupilla muscorum TaxID=225749 RepID=A0A0A6ZAD1_9EUPU|nr:ATP synthase F0 subunit 6 [Pupilla muscorum]AGC52871.1 ATP synthase F0 subunit 6 [Pupilla muscorum]
MMTDLFSSMDANYSFLLWSFPLFMTTFILMKTYYLNSLTSVFKASLTNLWTFKESYFWSKLFLTLAMSFIMLCNFSGLLPYVYGSTTSLWVNSSMALLFWGIFLLSGYCFSFKKSLAHLTPAGAPLMLIPFLILIESISILIRPLTLTVRLVANISAGHIILALMANVLSSLQALVPFTGVILVLMFYNLFEMFVSFIQSYIFTLLLSLYLAEHP